MKTLILILTLASIYSCNTVHKTTATVKENTDSVHVVKEETVSASKHDSVILKESSGNYTKETVIEFDSSAAPYFDKNIFYTHDGDANGKGGAMFLIKSPTKITIKETGTYQSKDSGNYSNFDTSASKQIDSAMKHQTIETKNTHKIATRVPIGIIIGSVVLIAFAFAVLYIGSKAPKIKKIDV